MTAETIATPLAEAAARTQVMADAETIVARYANGRVKTTSIPYLFTRISDLRGQELQAAFEHAYDAYRTWELSEGPGVDYRAMEPEMAHPEVYAERCRALLDEALEALCGGPR